MNKLVSKNIEFYQHIQFKLTLPIIILFGFLSCNRSVDISSYYEFINKAEIFIIQEKYDSALIAYEKAFIQYDSPWGLDYYNALLCASKTDKYDRSVQLTDSCIKRGIEMYYLDNDFLSPLHKYFKQEVFINKYDSIRQTYLNSFDTSVMRIFNFSFAKDQSLAKLFMSNTSSSSNDYYDVVLANTDTLIQIINNGKLPKYSYQYVQYDRMVNIPWITLRHYFGLRNSIRNSELDKNEYAKYYKMKRFYNNSFEELITKQIMLGKICPTLLTTTVIYNSKYKNIYGENGYVRIRNDIYAKEFSDNSKKIISQNRKELMLESYDNYRLKYRYSQRISDSIGCIPMGMFRFRVNHHCVTHLARDNKTRDFLIEEFAKKGYIKL